ncbi:MAG: metallophosphoesterase [Nanoarchaeota archaeon]|nr:metallophosphoesterase [Nanoarchaeota archaeon]
MKLVLLSDCHGSLKQCTKAVKLANKEKCSIIVAGDLMNWEDYKKPVSRFKRLLKALNVCKKKVYLIPGNYEDVKSWQLITDWKFTKYDKLVDFNNKIVDLKSHYLIGYGGATAILSDILDKAYFRVNPKFDELTLDKLLKNNDKPVIFVSHMPAYSYLDTAVFKLFKKGRQWHVEPCLDDIKGCKRKRVGDKVLKRLIEKNKPLLSVFGHVHEEKGKSEELITHKKKKESKNLVINCGPGNVILVDVGKTAKVLDVKRV